MNRSDFFIDDRVNVSFMYVGVSSWRLEGTTKTPAGKAKSCMEITSGSAHSLICLSLARIDLVTSQPLFYETFWLVKRIVRQRDGGIVCFE
ncbi:hypothetical protein ACS78_01570 [Priestia megaterium]|nr:hypothetical protein ACS78_01570 [Priestia megaterium]